MAFFSEVFMENFNHYNEILSVVSHNSNYLILHLFQ